MKYLVEKIKNKTRIALPSNHHL